MDYMLIYGLIACIILLLSALVVLAFWIRAESNEWRHHVQYLTDAHRVTCALLRRHIVTSIPAESIAIDPAVFALFSVDRHPDAYVPTLEQKNGTSIGHGDVEDLIRCLDEREPNEV